jgi:hypothetical protein
MIPDKERQVFLAVIDGQEPREWKPWATELEVLSRRFEGTDLILPTAYLDVSDCRVRLLLQSREVLFDRQESEWVRVVGAVVDGRTPTGQEALEIKQAFQELCQMVAGTKDAWFRTMGFFVLVVQNGKSGAQAQVDFSYDLKLVAKDRLGECVEVQNITDEGTLVPVLMHLNVQIIDAVVQDLRFSS